MFKDYFSAKYILSKGALFNYALSDRSDGKTFDCKARALEDFENNQSITVYMRRYKTEITEKLYTTFFDEVLRVDGFEKYREWTFKGSKQGVQVKRQGEDKWSWIIYFVPLTMSGKMKSQLDVLKINMIDYDEFIPHVITFTTRYGFDTALCKPSDKEKEYYALGHLIPLVNRIYDEDKISKGLKNEILIDNFRSDIAYDY